MGKTQSKRSVDITTDPKKGSEEEVTGKLEKIEDIDQKHLNGDATPQENDAEKKDNDESENDKDLTTEKSAEVAQASGDNNDEQNTTATNAAADTPKEEGGATAATVAEEISPLADESIKKSKKEKLKKKWSFRSISFGKKDKQKPAKTEEANDAAAATNGEAEKSSTAEVVTESPKKDEDAAGDATVEGKPKENGEASEQELNGQKTPTSEEKPASVIVASETSTTVVTAVAETSTVSAPTVAADSNETTNENQTESKAGIAAEIIEAAAAAVVSNGAEAATDVAEKANGVIDALAVAIDTKLNISVQAAATAEVSTTECAAVSDAVIVESNKTIPSVSSSNDDGEIPHQNGTNDADDVPEAEAAAPVESKVPSQIEVNTNTPDNSPAANLASSSTSTTTTTTTSSSNSNSTDPIASQFHDTNLNVSNTPEKDQEAAAAVAVAEENIATAVAVVVVDVDATVEEIVADTSVPDCRVEAPQCDSQPPPLPISPPPSQVSVFAFNNDVDVQTEVNVDNTNKIEASEIVESTPSAQPEALRRSFTNLVTIGEPVATNSEKEKEVESNETKAEEGVKVVDSIETEISIESAQPKISTTESNEINTEDDNAALVESCNTEPPKENAQPDDTSEQTLMPTIKTDEVEILLTPEVNTPVQNDELIVAAAVIQEITDKAVEIIQQQREERENKEEHLVEKQLEPEQGEVKVEETQIDDAESDQDNHNDEIKTPEQNGNSKQQAEDAKAVASETETETETVPNISIEKDIPQIPFHQSEAEEDTQNEKDCSSISSLNAANLIDKLSLNDVDNQDFISPTKEIANAKDLKENAAAEITTQDLPVTCE